MDEVNMKRYGAGSYEVVKDDDGEYYIADEVDTAMQSKAAEPVPCGGCGAKSDRERCIGCGHDFGTPESEWFRDRLPYAEILRELQELRAGRDAAMNEIGMLRRENMSLLEEVERLTVERDGIALGAQWARNRLNIIADDAWHGDGRDLKRSIIGIFADFDEALTDPSKYADNTVERLANSRAEMAMAFDVAAKWLIRAGIAGDATEDPLVTCIRSLTPADATAALAARDKATREQALRDAATHIDREIASYPGDWGSEFIAGLDRAKSVLK